MARYIDRTPPPPTGDPVVDSRAALEYLGYLREQVNFIMASGPSQPVRNGGVSDG